MRRKKSYKRKGFLEDLMIILLKPPKSLFFAGGGLLVIALFFNIDVWYWWVKIVDFLYLDKVMKILHSIFEVIIPK